MRRHSRRPALPPREAPATLQAPATLPPPLALPPPATLPPPPELAAALAGTPLVVGVVAYRDPERLAACLGALAEALPPAPACRVVVVDNGGLEQTAAVAGEAGALLWPAGENLGFAGGANVVLRSAVAAAEAAAVADAVPAGLGGGGPELVVLVNEDARVAPGFLAAMWAAHAAAPVTTGAFTGLLRLPDGRVNSTGVRLRRRGSAEDRDFGRDPAGLRPEPDVFGFCGGAAGLRTAALAEVGVLDDALFLYYEDVDLSWRLRARGYGVRFVPDAVAVHDLAASSGTRSEVFRYYNDRNSLTVFTRHAPWPTVAHTWARRALALAWHALRPSTRPLAATRTRAGRDALRRLPRTMRERRQLWRDAPARRAAVARDWLSSPRGGRGYAPTR